MKKYLYLLCIFIFMSLFARPVYAIEYTQGSCYYFNRTTGALASSGGRDCIKKFDGDYVWCVQWKNQFGVGSSYEVVSSWKQNSATAIKAGLIMDFIYDDDDLSSKEKYALTAATLNTYNSKLGSTWQPSKSYNFYSKNSNVKKYYDAAMDYYDKYVKLTTSLTTPSFQDSNGSAVKTSSMSYSSSGYYFSDMITLKGLLATYGNASDKVTYTLSSSSANTGAKVYFCTGKNGTGTCQESVTITGSASDYSFSIKATSVNADDIISIKVSGSNSSKYPTSIRYKYSSGTQKILKKSSVTISRSTSYSVQLTVPNTTNHTIRALKVDETGALLSGATLELYKDDVNSSSNLLASSSTSEVKYTTPKVDENADVFFSHSYYLVEKKALDGYILNTTVRDIYTAGTDINKDNVTTCYYTDEDGNTSVASDASHCNFSNYEYRCLSSNDELKDLSENGNCNFTASDTDEGAANAASKESTGTEDGNSSGENTGTEGDSSDEGDTPSEPEIEYEQICYSISSSSRVDSSYCKDKDKYTSVTKSGGNITITQPNVKNSVKISKRAMTGEDEVSGATLKICSASDYESKKEECDPATTIDDVEMSWVSGTTPTEFFGIKKGSYYIIEVTPPSGYIKTTIVTPFSIDEYGVVKNGETVVEDNLLVINNELNTLTISKQDIATSEELPGAQISICYTYVDDNGEIQLVTDQYENECIPAVLSDGSVATWTSTEDPKVIQGLPSGTYYLVEMVAPDGYSTAESILFTLKEDGTLTDKDGNILSDKKLVMYDQEMEEVQTGMLSFYIVFIILIVGVGLGFGTYRYMGKKSQISIIKNKKVRGRKVHKVTFKN